MCSFLNTEANFRCFSVELGNEGNIKTTPRTLEQDIQRLIMGLISVLGFDEDNLTVILVCLFF